jgi:hypothetical protein
LLFESLGCYVSVDAVVFQVDGHWRIPFVFGLA